MNGAFSIEEVIVTRGEHMGFTNWSGDLNPLHLGEEAILHGALINGKVSSCCWKKFGDGTKVTSIKEMNFFRPIRPDQPFRVLLSDGVPFIQHGILYLQVDVEILVQYQGREKLTCSGTLVLIPPAK
ncbi:hypothetical protein HY844_00500 [Candidatus Berkelbacteria bacterium]|nr:hypothetical protein [Candidatus Berkelbacteria bacterium]